MEVPIVGCRDVEIHFASRIVAFLSWSAAASHPLNVKLTPYCTGGPICSLNCTVLYASSRSTAVARVGSFLKNPLKTPWVDLAAFS